MCGLVTAFARQAYRPISSFTRKNSNIFKKKLLNIGASLQSYSTYNSYFNLGTINATLLKGKIYCPIDSYKNKYYEEVKDENIKWAVETGLVKEKTKAYDRFCAADFSKLCAYCYPRGSREDLLLVSNWVSFLFCYDDDMDRNSTVIGKDPEALSIRNIDLINVLKTGKYNANIPLEVCMNDIKRRLDGSRDLNLEDFIDSLDRGFQSKILEATNRKNNNAFSVESYKLSRDYGSGVETCIEMGFIIDYQYLSPKVRNNIAVRSMMTLCNRIVSYTNDIFSLESEMNHKDMNNIILLKMNEDKSSLKNAFNESIDLVNKEMIAFTEWEKILPKRKPYSQFALILKSWIRGNLDWSIETARYKFHLMENVSKKL